MKPKRLTQKQWRLVTENGGLIGDLFARKFKDFAGVKRRCQVRMLLEDVFQDALIKAARTHNGRTKFGYWFNFVALQLSRRSLATYYNQPVIVTNCPNVFDATRVYDPPPDDTENVKNAVGNLVERTVAALGWSKKQANLIVLYLTRKMLLKDVGLALKHSTTWVKWRIEEFKAKARELATESDRILAFC